MIEQCLVDLIAWVEDDVEPAETAFDFQDGRVLLPDGAAARGGIQPVVSVTANGSARTEVWVGELVAWEVLAEVPPGAGAVIAVQWDFERSGSYPESAKLDAAQPSVRLQSSHAYGAPGTYFATALVESHRAGDLQAISRRVPNLASARIVVV